MGGLGNDVGFDVSLWWGSMGFGHGVLIWVMQIKRECGYWSGG